MKVKGHDCVWRRIARLASVCAATLAFSGCALRGRAPAPHGASAPTLQELRTATYIGFAVQPGPVTLIDGGWEGEPYVAGGASRPHIAFVRDFRLVGDLDGDGRDEAAVLLAESAGGSGESVYLAVVGRADGSLRNLGTARIGDGVQIRHASIAAERVRLEVVQAGPQDAMCCPGELRTREWQLLPTGPHEVAVPGAVGRLSLETLAGTEWVLREWARGEAAPASPEITLVFLNGRFVGRSGCNHYFAAVIAGRSPGELSLGPSGSTRMSCPDDVMAIEGRFLLQLKAAKGLSFMATWLALSYEQDGVWNTMLFEGRAQPAPSSNVVEP